MSPLVLSRRLPRLLLWFLAFVVLAGALVAATALGFML